MSTTDSFFMVWSPQGTAPTFMHKSHVEALAEAKRLSSANPAKKFYVLMAWSLVETICPAPTVTHLDF